MTLLTNRLLLEDSALSNMTVGVVILTLNAEKHIFKCLPPWLNSPLKPRVLIVDSSSSDATISIAKTLGAEVLIIPKAKFNHGATREKARKHLGTDIVVMLTHDAYAVSSSVLTQLILPIVEKKASAAYARQIPHPGAKLFEAFPRQFNYPAESHIRSINDLNTYGIYTFFCSNTCAAYCNKALDDVGGFPTVLLGEDTIVAARLLHNQQRIAYVAEAIVRHSHNYTLAQEFQRHFDIGLMRREFRELFACHETDNKRGNQYVKKLYRCLISEYPYLLPYGVIHTFTKWIGYHFGHASYKAPTWFKKIFSSQR